MKRHIYILLLTMVAFAPLLSSCRDDAEYPFPVLQNGASFVADLERPDNVFTSNANINAVTLPAAGGTFAFKTFSANANEIAKVEMYVKHLVALAPPSTTLATVIALPNPGGDYGRLVKEFTSFGNREEFSIAQLTTSAGAASIKARDRFQLIFVATMKDGRVFTGGAGSSGTDFRNRPLGQIFTPSLVVTLN